MKLPCNCPSCDTPLKIRALRCENCETEVTGMYDLPLLARLSASDQDFIIEFVKKSGSLKDMAKHLGLSYPTVRNLLDEIIQRINTYEK